MVGSSIRRSIRLPCPLVLCPACTLQDTQLCSCQRLFTHIPDANSINEHNLTQTCDVLPRSLFPSLLLTLSLVAFLKRAQAGCAAQKVGHVISTEPTRILWFIQVSVGDFKFLMEHRCYVNICCAEYVNICCAELLRVEQRGRSSV
jgi:hypothetical protein